MGSYGPCHPSTVLIRLPFGLFGVEDGPAQFGMSRVDRGVDDRDQHACTDGHAVGFGQPKLCNDVLRNIARYLLLLHSGIVLQREHIIRLRDTDPFALECTDDVVKSSSVAEAETEYRTVQGRQSLGADGRHPQTSSQGERSLLLTGADVHKHFVGNEPGLPSRRNAGEAGFTGKRAPRQAVASDGS